MIVNLFKEDLVVVCGAHPWGVLGGRGKAPTGHAYEEVC